MVKTQQVVFSDLDGTLIHMSSELESLGTFAADGCHFTAEDRRVLSVRPLPPSTTGLLGYISEETLELVQALRRAGHLLVLISGARSTTFFQRLPFLPAADAYVMENGGRIFLPVTGESALTAAPMLEDRAWRELHTAAGPGSQDSVVPSKRSGELWDLMRRLEGEGWAVDAGNYNTNFRINLAKSQGKKEADLQVVMTALPSTLAASFNLGVLDIYPATSGKASAARYLMDRFGLGPESCVSMGDDDNDLELASIVRHTYIPGFTADSVRAAVEADPTAFTVAQVGGFVGTNALLANMAEEFGDLSSTASPSQLYAALLLPAVALLLLGLSVARRRRRR